MVVWSNILLSIYFLYLCKKCVKKITSFDMLATPGADMLEDLSAFCALYTVILLIWTRC
jgi:hypothetical protein